MTHEERIKQIEDHFNSISIEEFEKNLEECGIGRIKPIRHCKECFKMLSCNKENDGFCKEFVEVKGL